MSLSSHLSNVNCSDWNKVALGAAKFRVDIIKGGAKPTGGGGGGFDLNVHLMLSGEPVNMLMSPYCTIFILFVLHLRLCKLPTSNVFKCYKSLFIH